MVEYFGDQDVDQIDLFALEKFRKSLNRQTKAQGRNGKVSPYTIHGYVRGIKRFFHYLKLRHIIDEDPSVDLEKPKLPKQPRKGINPQEAMAMLDAAASDPREFPDQGGLYVH